MKRRKHIKKISITVLICLVVGGVGAVATQSSVSTWYMTIEKPAFTPPNWLFGPVWTVLYILMGIAAGLVWIKGFYHKWVKVALYHFGFQLLFNGMWSVIFFGMQKPFLGLLAIIVLFILIILTIKWFTVVDRRASWLMVPYALWVLFATALNFEIWRLNS